jgi:hypothetical protein
MCNKLSILCLMLAVVATLSVSASAGSTITLATPLKVDIAGRYGNTVRCEWMDWQIAVDNGTFVGPQNKLFDMGSPLPWENPAGTLEAYRKNQSPDNAGASRNRSGGWAGVLGTGEFYAGGKGFGMNYVKLTISQLDPDTTYKIFLWSYEQRSVWASRADNVDDKWGCWSTTNPKKWLDENGYSGFNGEPNGYGPIVNDDTILPPRTDSNMPAGLKDLVLACGAQGGRAFLMTDPCNTDQGDNLLTDSLHCVSFYFHTNPGEIASGNVTVYGWIDPTDWGGSLHMPLNGFMVIPEPATVALLGLGGLALLRRKRA